MKDFKSIWTGSSLGARSALVVGAFAIVAVTAAIGNWAMTKEYEWAKYNKRDLYLNKEQLLALGDRNFPVREKKLEFQHPNVAYFNIGHKNLPPKDS